MIQSLSTICSILVLGEAQQEGQGDSYSSDGGAEDNQEGVTVEDIHAVPVEDDNAVSENTATVTRKTETNTKETNTTSCTEDSGGESRDESPVQEEVEDAPAEQTSIEEEDEEDVENIDSDSPINIDDDMSQVKPEVMAVLDYAVSRARKAVASATTPSSSSSSSSEAEPEMTTSSKNVYLQQPWVERATDSELRSFIYFVTILVRKTVHLPSISNATDIELIDYISRGVFPFDGTLPAILPSPLTSSEMKVHTERAKIKNRGKIVGGYNKKYKRPHGSIGAEIVEKETKKLCLGDSSRPAVRTNQQTVSQRCWPRILPKGNGK